MFRCDGVVLGRKKRSGRWVLRYSTKYLRRPHFFSLLYSMRLVLAHALSAGP